MSKQLKIIIVIACIILAVMLGIFIFVPGLPTYIRVKIQYPEIDLALKEYAESDVEVPADFVRVKFGDIYVKGPSGALNRDSAGSQIILKDDTKFLFKDKGEIMVMAYKSEKGNINNLSDFYEPEFSEAEERWFYSELDMEYPDTLSESIGTMYAINSKDCLKLRGTDSEIFLDLAKGKTAAAEIETPYIYKNGNISGYVCDIHKGSYKYCRNVVFDWNSSEYIISIYGNSLETVEQIIASIETAEEE
ncbi:MAG: hypothetical protein ACI4JE_02505 [Ruminococcus sp.]